MNKHLFLQGDIDIGKSTIIREAVLPYIDDVGGFFTVKLFRDKHKVGFALRSFQNAEDYKLKLDIGDTHISGMFMYRQKDKWTFNTDVFSIEAKAYLTQASNKKLIVIDEVGGLELKNPEFTRELKLCLDGDIPILGVLKSQKNLYHLQKKTKFDISDMFPLSSYIKKTNDIEVITLTEVNRSEIIHKVKEHVKKAIARDQNRGIIYE